MTKRGLHLQRQQMSEYLCLEAVSGKGLNLYALFSPPGQMVGCSMKQYAELDGPVIWSGKFYWVCWPSQIPKVVNSQPLFWDGCAEVIASSFIQKEFQYFRYLFLKASMFFMWHFELYPCLSLFMWLFIRDWNETLFGVADCFNLVPAQIPLKNILTK